jgi:hypothetical protein
MRVSGDPVPKLRDIGTPTQKIGVNSDPEFAEGSGVEGTFWFPL